MNQKKGAIAEIASRTSKAANFQIAARMTGNCQNAAWKIQGWFVTITEIG